MLDVLAVAPAAGRTREVTAPGHSVDMSGIRLRLDPAAASAVDATFPNLNLPAGLAFGTATVTLRP